MPPPLLLSPADWATLQSCEYRHESGRAIRAIYPNALGTRAVVIDDAYAGVLFSPVDTRALPVPSMPDSVNKVRCCTPHPEAQ